MHKTKFIEQVVEGERFEDVFLVKSARLSETRAGKPYLILTVADKTGEIGGPIWEDAEELALVCQPGSFIRIAGMAQSYRDKLQLKVDSVSAVDASEIVVADFMAASRRHLGRMADELQDIVRTIGDSYIKKLLNQFFKKGQVWQDFQQWPAAKGIHHAYVGGLMEHSLSVAKLADSMAFHYDGVDRSVVIAAALLHDIGKLEELRMEMGLVEYTDQGRLKGHLVIGSEMVGQAAAEIEDFPDSTLTKIQHIILSHHGKLEFGSPTLPMTVEAFIVSFIDDMDAKMNLMEQARRKLDGSDHNWTEYQRTLERYLFLNGIDDDSSNVQATDGSERQQRLF